MIWPLRSPLGQSEAAFAVFSLVMIAAARLGVDPHIQRPRGLYPRRRGVRNHHDGQRLVPDSSLSAQNDRGGGRRGDVRRCAQRSGQAAIQTQYFHGGSRCLYHDQQSFSRRDLREYLCLGSSRRSRSARLGGGEGYTRGLISLQQDLSSELEISAKTVTHNSRGGSHRSVPEAGFVYGRLRLHAAHFLISAHA